MVPWLESTTSKPAALPPGRRRVGLHRVVVFLRSGVLRVQHDGGRRDLGLQVALLDHGRQVAVERVRLGLPLGGERDVVRLLVVVDQEGLGGLPGLFGRLGDDQRHRPAQMGHPVVLEEGDARVRGHAHQSGVVGVEARGVVVVEHGEDTGHSEHGLGVQGTDPAAGDGGQHQPAVGEFGERDLAGCSGRRR